MLMTDGKIITQRNIQKDNNNHYIVGSQIGAKSRGIRRALRRRASNNTKGLPCCIHNNVKYASLYLLRQYEKNPIPESESESKNESVKLQKEQVKDLKRKLKKARLLLEKLRST